jgi:hypothetical protein
VSTETIHLSTTPIGITLDFEALADTLTSSSTKPEISWRPVFVRISPSEFADLRALCKEHHLTLIDTIDRQLDDLAAVRRSSKRNSADLDYLTGGIPAPGERTSYGNWVYLPWESKIVHLLNRDDYFDVITNRNQDKITREEQKELRTKRIGVIGLSVGGGQA